MPALTLYPSSRGEPPRTPVALSQGTSGISLRVTQQFGRSDPRASRRKGYRLCVSERGQDVEFAAKKACRVKRPSPKLRRQMGIRREICRIVPPRTPNPDAQNLAAVGLFGGPENGGESLVRSELERAKGFEPTTPTLARIAVCCQNTRWRLGCFGGNRLLVRVVLPDVGSGPRVLINARRPWPDRHPDRIMFEPRRIVAPSVCSTIRRSG